MGREGNQYYLFNTFLDCLAPEHLKAYNNKKYNFNIVPTVYGKKINQMLSEINASCIVPWNSQSLSPSRVPQCQRHGSSAQGNKSERMPADLECHKQEAGKDFYFQELKAEKLQTLESKNYQEKKNIADKIHVRDNKVEGKQGDAPSVEIL